MLGFSFGVFEDFFRTLCVVGFRNVLKPTKESTRRRILYSRIDKLPARRIGFDIRQIDIDNAIALVDDFENSTLRREIDDRCQHDFPITMVFRGPNRRTIRMAMPRNVNDNVFIRRDELMEALRRHFAIKSRRTVM